MEKAVPTALPERQEQDDGEKAVLMTLVPHKEDFAALECPQGEERIATFFKDAKASLESASILGASKEKAAGLKEVVPSSADEVTAMSGKGKLTDEMCSRKEDPNLSPFSQQEPNNVLETSNMTGMF